jgi:hypothetical protein
MPVHLTELNASRVRTIEASRQLTARMLSIVAPHTFYRELAGFMERI